MWSSFYRQDVNLRRIAIVFRKSLNNLDNFYWETLRPAPAGHDRAGPRFSWLRGLLLQWSRAYRAALSCSPGSFFFSRVLFLLLCPQTARHVIIRYAAARECGAQNVETENAAYTPGLNSTLRGAAFETQGHRHLIIPNLAGSHNWA